VIAGSILAISRTARADDRPAAERAAEHYRRGRTHYNLAEWDQAVTEFKAAYALSRAPELLYDLGQVFRYRPRPDCAQAAWHYRAFLRERPRAANRAGIEQLIRQMDACAARAPAEPPSSQPGAPAAAPSPPRPESGPPAAAATPPARPGTHARAAADVGGAPGPAPRHPIVGPALTLASGLGIAGAGAGLLAWSSSRHAHFEGSCAPACDPDAVAGAAAAQTVGWIVIGVGAAVTTLGAVLWLRASRAAGATGPRLTLAPTFGGLIVRGEL
jgi:hypothetical protein